MMYTQSNCITRHKTNRSETACTHTEQSLAHLAAHACCRHAAAGSPRSAGDSRSCSHPRGRLHACQELQQYQCNAWERETTVQELIVNCMCRGR